MVDHCFRCQRVAPRWDRPEHLEWHELTSERGEHLGLLCTDCLDDGDLVLIHLEALYALVA